MQKFTGNGFTLVVITHETTTSIMFDGPGIAGAYFTCDNAVANERIAQQLETVGMKLDGDKIVYGW